MTETIVSQEQEAQKALFRRIIQTLRQKMEVESDQDAQKLYLTDKTYHPNPGSGVGSGKSLIEANHSKYTVVGREYPTENFTLVITNLNAYPDHGREKRIDFITIRIDSGPDEPEYELYHNAVEIGGRVREVPQGMRGGEVWEVSETLEILIKDIPNWKLIAPEYKQGHYTVTRDGHRLS